MSYRSPSNSSGNNTTGNHMRGSPFGKQLPDGPIQDLCTVIDKTQPEDWQKRTQAFCSLVATIPTGREYGAVEAWYNSPPILRHLAWPLSELLKDARSTVVKRTCDACADLFVKCQLDARYLLKDIMPTVLGVHAQTVAVIRSAVQTMIVDAMAVTPCKMAMPMWLDRLKSDKSRGVREACGMYLGIGLAEWSEPGYLSMQIWEQVGTALVKALRDSTPAVRQIAKKGLETIFLRQSDIFDRLVDNSELVRDVRVKKLLARIHAGETVGDDISVASSRVGSVASRSNYRGGGGGGGGGTSSNSAARGSPGYPQRTGGGGGGGFPQRPSSTRSSGGIPATIGVTSPQPAYMRGTTSNNGVPPHRTKGGGLGPPVRMQGPFQAAVDSPPKLHRLENEREREAAAAAAAAEQDLPMDDVLKENSSVSIALDDEMALHPDPTLSASFETAETNDSELLPVIASVDELHEFAKSRGANSRRSSMLQERFARSNSSTMAQSTAMGGSAAAKAAAAAAATMEGTDHGDFNLDLDEILNKESEEVDSNAGGGGGGGGVGTVSATIDGDYDPKTVGGGGGGGVDRRPPPILTSIVVPEHTRIAHELLEAHKKHVDLIMETLKVEMDALKEFELVLLDDEEKREGDARRPTEDEVLEYFESVGLCVEQRAKAGSILQKKMDKISSGAT